MSNKTITLAHGNGGVLMRELIEEYFSSSLGQFGPDTDLDAAPLPDMPGELLITTDGFTVQPLEFPGGNIGSLAIHGIINDLAVSGARCQCLTLNAFIEEGLQTALLKRITGSLATAAQTNGVRIVAGDTKVVRRGEGSGLYLAATGIGRRLPRASVDLGYAQIREGDVVMVSGPVGDHGTAVMLAREEFGLSGDLESDSASVLPLAEALLPLPGLRFMRDPTRGGLATVAHEIAHSTSHTVRIYDSSVPVGDPVRSVCDILGFDPYYLACEGRVVSVVAPEIAEVALESWRGLPAGRYAMPIGVIEKGSAQVVLETELGGERLLEELVADPLPRIC